MGDLLAVSVFHVEKPFLSPPTAFLSGKLFVIMILVGVLVAFVLWRWCECWCFRVVFWYWRFCVEVGGLFVLLFLCLWLLCCFACAGGLAVLWWRFGVGVFAVRVLAVVF